MFDAIFPKHWTTLQRLMWLKTNALAHAVYETISGNPVSFAAKAAPLRQLSVAFSPKQDLHGYDSPWPAGGGANKFDVSANPIEQGTIQGANGEDADSNNRIRTDGFIKVSPSTTYCVVFSGSVGRYFPHWYNASKAHTSSGTAWIANGDTFTTPADSEYVRLVFSRNDDAAVTPASINSIAINYPSSVTTFVPYSNECPILGWDSLNVEQRGKNLFSGEKLANASISASGTLENNNSNDILIARVFEGETYTFSLNPSGVTVGGFFTDYPTMDSVTYNNARLYLSGSESYTYTVPQGVKYIGVRYLKTFTEYQISLGYTLPSEYTPYNPSSRSISISLGSTVYSGWVDPTTGDGLADKAGSTLNALTKAGSIVNGTVSSAQRYVLPNYSTAVAANQTHGAIFSVGRETVAYFAAARVNEALPAGYGDGTFAITTDGVALCVYDTDKTITSAAFDAKYGAMQVCWPLATPIPISLTPQEVESLAGDNTMWTDADSLTVEYRSN